MYQVGTCGGLCLSLFAIYIYLCVFTPGNIKPCLLRILDIVRTRTRDSFNAERRDADTIWNRVAIATRQNYNLGKPSKKCVNKEIFLKGVRRSILKPNYFLVKNKVSGYQECCSENISKPFLQNLEAGTNRFYIALLPQILFEQLQAFTQDLS